MKSDITITWLLTRQTYSLKKLFSSAVVVVTGGHSSACVQCFMSSSWSQRCSALCCERLSVSLRRCLPGGSLVLRA